MFDPSFGDLVGAIIATFVLTWLVTWAWMGSVRSSIENAMYGERADEYTKRLTAEAKMRDLKHKVRVAQEALGQINPPDFQDVVVYGE